MPFYARGSKATLLRVRLRARDLRGGARLLAGRSLSWHDLVRLLNRKDVRFRCWPVC